MRLRTNVKSKAFTLIELLVVISIIGLLTSIILVGLKKAREKAKIAKTAVWARSVFTELGVYAVLNLNFNDCCPGGTCTDLSEYGNNGTVSGGVTCDEGVPGFTGKALYFDGLNGMVYSSRSDPFEYRGGEFTISFWAYPDPAETSGGKIISKPWNGHGQYNYWVAYNSNRTVNIHLCGTTGWSINTTETLSAGNWHHIVVTFIGPDKVKVYFNGNQVIDTTHTISSWNPSAGDTNVRLAIGTLYPYGGAWAGNTGFSFNGTIDEVHIYKRALTAFEIQKHYAEGLLRHQLAEK